MKLKQVKLSELKVWVAKLVEKQDNNYRAAMAKIKKTNERASINKCPICLKPHKKYKVRYDSEGVAFVMCGTTRCRINVDANWIVVDEGGM